MNDRTACTMLCCALAMPASIGVVDCDRRPASPSAAPLRVTSTTAADSWCAEHGVPEALCTRCHPELIPDFKAKGDWCAGHGLPESQCVLCNPGLKEKWAALRGDSGAMQTRAPAASGRRDARPPLRVESARRPLDRPNDPLCTIEQRQIRLLDPSFVEKAGIEIEPVQAREMSAVIECPGEIDYDRTRLVQIAPRVAGVIAEVVAASGARVAAGDVLALFESPALGSAKSRYIELA
ncbi:MAG TPA: efflux RND transporter periplasmic adaptor subunit, partial [Phycisphaerae bacterium]